MTKVCKSLSYSGLSYPSSPVVYLPVCGDVTFVFLVLPGGVTVLGAGQHVLTVHPAEERGEHSPGCHPGYPGSAGRLLRHAVSHPHRPGQRGRGPRQVQAQRRGSEDKRKVGLL